MYSTIYLLKSKFSCTYQNIFLNHTYCLRNHRNQFNIFLMLQNFLIFRINSLFSSSFIFQITWIIFLIFQIFLIIKIFLVFPIPNHLNHSLIYKIFLIQITSHFPFTKTHPPSSLSSRRFCDGINKHTRSQTGTNITIIT